MTKPLICNDGRCKDFYVKEASYGTCGRDGQTVRRFNHCRFGRYADKNPPEFHASVRREDYSKPCLTTEELSGLIDLLDDLPKLKPTEEIAYAGCRNH